MKLLRSLIIGLFVLSFLGCVPEKEIIVPDELIGLWSTSASRYADRHFEFTKNMLIFKVGDEETGVHKIKELERSGDGNATWYTVTYLSLGEKYKFSFSYYPANDGIITIVNQANVQWARVNN
ncbi:MAG: hypothetical protein GTO40_28415 [Deltaproteobacteria bacterium]|nr:hypothetical protein [Deltaproteobacteria bacterium]